MASLDMTDSFMDESLLTTDLPTNLVGGVFDEDPTNLTNGRSASPPVDRRNRLEWVRQFAGTPNAFLSRGEDVAVDRSGNSYVVGEDSSEAGFLAKFNPQGVLQWLKSINPLPGRENVKAVAVDGDSVYIGGASETAGGGGSINAAFLGKYDSQGNEQWIVKPGEDASRSQIDDLAVDRSGKVYAAGNRNTSAWIAGYDGSGQQSWAKSFNEAPTEGTISIAQGIAIDNRGELLVSGKVGQRVVNQPVPNQSSFLGRFDNQGNQTWLNTLSQDIASDSLEPIKVATNRSGNAFVINSFGGEQRSIERYDRQGNFVWKSELPEPLKQNRTSIKDIKVGTNGRVYASGDTLFNPTGEGAPSSGYYAQLKTSNGDFLLARRLRSSLPGGFTIANGLALDQRNQTYLAGVTVGGLGDQQQTNPGAIDAFVAKYRA